MFENKARDRSKHNYCFVPGCTNGFYNAKRRGIKVSLFGAPSDPEILAKWQRAIPRVDRELDKNSVVCEVHFDSDCIERYFRHVINGEEVLLARGRPLLKKDAVPTQFPSLPSYFSKTVRKRKPPRVRSTPVTKKKVVSRDVPLSPALSRNHQTLDGIGNDEFVPSDVPSSLLFMEEDLSLDDMCNVELPNQYWVCVKYPNDPSVRSFSMWASPEDLAPQKKMTVNKLSNNKFLCTLYLKYFFIEAVDVSSASDVQALLKNLNNLHCCKGVGASHEFSDFEFSSELIHHEGNAWSYQCSHTVPRISACAACGKLRKQMHKRRSYVKHKTGSKTSCG